MTIRIALPRPDADDPVLRAAWDEAKRLCKARDVVAELDAMDESLRQTAREHRNALVAAESRPIGATPDPDCCVGDRSRCRCQAKQLAMTDEDVDREKWMQVWAGDE